MKMLYVTTTEADYLQDSLLYGLRKKLGADVIDWPKKDIMYKGNTESDLYGSGFTLWKNLDDIPINRDGMKDRIEKEEFDYIVMSSIFRQQLLFAHLVNYNWFKKRSKFIFVDGEDDGFPCVYDAIKYGKYFKRENPNNYDLTILGLSIPQEKMLTSMPKKDSIFTTHVQCQEAYRIKEVAEHCAQKVQFSTEKSYYDDLSRSMYGIAMKKSGWDVPRLMENASHYVVNCIYAFSEWDKTWWKDKPANTHPLGLEDGKNCIIWNDAKDLVKKLESVKDDYPRLAQASRDWAETKTCEKSAEYFLSKI